jgi:hypothetical protein
MTAKPEPILVSETDLATLGELYAKPCAFDHEAVAVTAYVILTPDGRKLALQTYNGCTSTSRHLPLEDALRTYPLPDVEMERVRLVAKGYSHLNYEATPKPKRGRPRKASQ